MTITLIVLFILIGVFLIWLELFIVPGITVAGIGGTVLILGGIYFAYAIDDKSTGHITLLISVLLIALVFFLSFRSNTWKKTALTTNVEGQVASIPATIKVGDSALTVSRLAPVGKILIDGEVIEAKSKLGLIDQKEEVTVIEIYNTSVLVEKKQD